MLTLARLPYFATFASAGGGGCDPPGVSKLSVVELSGKNQRIALDEYSRLVVRFLILGKKLTPFWGSKVKFSRNRRFFNFTLPYFKNY